MIEKSPYEDLPETVRAAFANCTLISLSRAAALLNMDRETLRRMLRRAEITARQKGQGLKRPRFVFTITDIAKYLRSTCTVEMRRRELIDCSSGALRYRSPSGVTMNVRLARRRRKPKTRTKPEGLDGEAQKT